MAITTIKNLPKIKSNSNGNSSKPRNVEFKSLSDNDLTITQEELEFAKLHRMAMKDLKVDDSKNQTI